MDRLAHLIAQKYATAYLNIGDLVYYGKYKNHVGKITAFGQDKWGNPTIEVEPIPRGRKKLKTIGLYRVWRKDVKDRAKAEQARLTQP